MPTQGEIIERLTKELTLHKVLEAAEEVKTLEELIAYIKAQLES